MRIDNSGDSVLHRFADQIGRFHIDAMLRQAKANGHSKLAFLAGHDQIVKEQMFLNGANCAAMIPRPSQQDANDIGRHLTRPREKLNAVQSGQAHLGKNQGKRAEHLYCRQCLLAAGDRLHREIAVEQILLALEGRGVFADDENPVRQCASLQRVYRHERAIV